LADGAGIRGTPAFVINGYYLSGAQPLKAFKRLVRYALAHPGSKATASVTAPTAMPASAPAPTRP